MNESALYLDCEETERIVKTKEDTVKHLLFGLTGNGECPFDVVLFGANFELTGKLRWVGGDWGLYVSPKAHMSFTSRMVDWVAMREDGVVLVRLYYK